MKNIIISKFSNIKMNTPTDITLWDWLNDTSYKEMVLKIRSISNKEEIKKLKAHLPCVTISGQFSKRNTNALIKHSGYICIDIDGADNEHITDFRIVRDELRKIKNIAYAALSVSGKGVFCIIPIKYAEKHKQHFEALKLQFLNIGLTIDKACSDVSRLRIYSFDPDAYFNDIPSTFNQFLYYEEEKKLKVINSVTEQIIETKLNDNKIVQIINKISHSGIDITEKYEQWFQIGCAFANEFGEDGRDFFHLVSQNHPKYHYESCDIFYSKCLTEKYNYSIGTFFHWANHYGID